MPFARVDDQHAAAARGAREPRDGPTAACRRDTSLPSAAPKPPGSRKSRCMSMISKAAWSSSIDSGAGSASKVMFGIAFPQPRPETTCKNRASIAVKRELGAARADPKEASARHRGAVVAASGVLGSSKCVHNHRTSRAQAGPEMFQRHEAKDRIPRARRDAGALGKLSERGASPTQSMPWSRPGAQALALPIDPAWRGGVGSTSTATDGGSARSTSFHCPTTPSPPRCSMHERGGRCRVETAADIAAAVAAGRGTAEHRRGSCSPAFVSAAHVQCLHRGDRGARPGARTDARRGAGAA